MADVCSRLAALLHAAGVPVTPERAGRLAATMALAPPATNDELYWLARITLLADHAHIEVFDRVFSQIFGGIVDPADFRGGHAATAGGGTGRDTPPRAGPRHPAGADDATETLGPRRSPTKAMTATTKSDRRPSPRSSAPTNTCGTRTSGP